MAKTYGELILEYQNYDHSQEHYELMKECYELNLMEKYIQNQQFMAESMDDIRTEFKEFDESYFGESVSEDNLQALIESANNKSKGIFNRIWKGIKSLWKKIAGFFNKLFGRSKKNNSKIETALEKLKSIPKPVLAIAILGTAGAVAHNTSVPGKGFKPLKELIEECWTDEYKNDGFVIADNQPDRKYAASILNLKAIRTSNLNHLADMLAAACSEKIVVIKSTGDKDIISLEDLHDIFKMMTDGNDLAKVKAIKKKMDSLIAEGHKKGITIQVSNDSLDRASASFNEISNALNNVPEVGDMDPNVSTMLNDIYTKLNIIIGNTMKAYSDLEGYRTAVLSKLQNFRVPNVVTDTEPKKETNNTKAQESKEDSKEESKTDE